MTTRAPTVPKSQFSCNYWNPQFLLLTNERSTTRRVSNPQPPSRTSSRSDPSGNIFYLIENMRSQWQSKMSPCIFLGYVSKIRNHNNSDRMFPSLLLCLIKDIRSQRRFIMFPGIFLGRVPKIRNHWRLRRERFKVFTVFFLSGTSEADTNIQNTFIEEGMEINMF